MTSPAKCDHPRKRQNPLDFRLGIQSYLKRYWPFSTLIASEERRLGARLIDHEAKLENDPISPTWVDRGFEDHLLYRSVVEASVDCIKVIDLNGRLQYLSPQGCSLMELDAPAAVVGRLWEDLWPDQTKERVRSAISSAAAGGHARFQEVCENAKGRPIWWDVNVSPIRDRYGQILRILAVSRDITAQRRAAEKLEWTTSHDALTSLPNRRAFELRLNAATLRAMASGGEVGLFLLDLDYFKHVNDVHGHAAGDLILCSLAYRLQQGLGDDSFLARTGGDEFAIIVEPRSGKIDAHAAGQKLMSLLDVPVAFEQHHCLIGGSIGGAVFPTDADSARDLFKHAGIALYALKRTGRGGMQMSDCILQEEAKRVAKQLTFARNAITPDAIEPHYQPKVELRSNRLVGFEALLRWRHETLGLQSPNSVFEAFKDCELASKIGGLMQECVFRDMRHWLNNGFPFETVAINAAPAEFLRGDFASKTLERLAIQRIPAHLLEIEITEHVFHKGCERQVAQALIKLRQAGVRIALDDFGTGFSSLSYLRDFPVDAVKIDRSFVERMTMDREVDAIVCAVFNLARQLGIDVIAEGIESELQRTELRKFEGIFGQGYLLGKPVKGLEVPRTIFTNRSGLTVGATASVPLQA